MSLSSEEISKEAASYVGGKLVGWGFDAFRKIVVERLSKRRAEEFLRAFATATADPNSSTDDFPKRLNYTDSMAQGNEIVQSPLNLFDVLGSWGPKIQQLGMIETVTSQTVFKPRKGSADPFDDDDRPYYSLKESILSHDADLRYVDLILTAVKLMN